MIRSRQSRRHAGSPVLVLVDPCKGVLTPGRSSRLAANSNAGGPCACGCTCASRAHLVHNTAALRAPGRWLDTVQVDPCGAAPALGDDGLPASVETEHLRQPVVEHDEQPGRLGAEDARGLGVDRASPHWIRRPDTGSPRSQKRSRRPKRARIAGSASGSSGEMDAWTAKSAS